jgi:hypothetical protein
MVGAFIARQECHKEARMWWKPGGITFKQLTTNHYLFGPTPPNLTIIQRGDHELIQYLFQTVFLAFGYGKESLAISALEGAILQPTGAINGPRSLVLAPSLIGVSWGIREEELGYFAKSNELLKRMTLVFLHV